MVRQLQQERAQAAREVERFDAALAALNGSANHRGASSRRLSPAARARIAAAQRARWAKVHATEQSAANGSPRKRTLSSAARKRIAAAQRARGAKFKAANGKRKQRSKVSLLAVRRA